jgi:hypothetical protein
VLIPLEKLKYLFYIYRDGTVLASLNPRELRKFILCLGGITETQLSGTDSQKINSVASGITATKRKVLRIFFRFQYNERK